MKMSIRRKPLTEQQEQVVRLHEVDKLNFSEISRKLRLSRTRVGHIWQEAQARLQDYEANGSRAVSLLPGKVRKFLEENELADVEKLRKAIETGRVCWDEDWQARLRRQGHRWEHDDRTFNLACYRNMGWKSWLVMLEWTGLPLPPPRKLLTCPHCGGTFPE